MWFLTVLHECLGGLKPVVMSDRNQDLLAAVPRIFRVENHKYCVWHLTENLMTETGRLGIRGNALKELVKEMFNRVAFATTTTNYDGVMEEIRRYNRELAMSVEKNEPEC